MHLFPSRAAREQPIADIFPLEIRAPARLTPSMFAALRIQSGNWGMTRHRLDLNPEDYAVHYRTRRWSTALIVAKTLRWLAA